MSMVSIDDYLNGAKQLPPAPQLLPELLTLLNQPNIDGSRIVRLITYDPSLTASVLQICNSAYVAPSTPVVHLDEAVVRLGFDRIYRFVASSLGSRTITYGAGKSPLDTKQLWKHSVTVAVAAQLIASDLGEDENLAFTAGLLHDLGKIVLSAAVPEGYAKLIHEVEVNQYSLIEAEKRVFGLEHEELGGRLMTRWKFPLNLTSAVWFHHHPAAAQPHQRTAALVHLGNLISYLLGYGHVQQAVTLSGRTQALEILKLSPESLPRYMSATFQQYAAIEALVAVS